MARKQRPSWRQAGRVKVARAKRGTPTGTDCCRSTPSSAARASGPDRCRSRDASCTRDRNSRGRP
eukprot:7005659-Prymnesium_polylepis.1